MAEAHEQTDRQTDRERRAIPTENLRPWVTHSSGAGLQGVHVLLLDPECLIFILPGGLAQP